MLSPTRRVTVDSKDIVVLNHPSRGHPDGRCSVNAACAVDADNELSPLYVDIGDCMFPLHGHYIFEIYFSTPGGGEVLKGEFPLTVHFYEE